MSQQIIHEAEIDGFHLTFPDGIQEGDLHTAFSRVKDMLAAEVARSIIHGYRYAEDVRLSDLDASILVNYQYAMRGRWDDIARIQILIFETRASDEDLELLGEYLVAWHKCLWQLRDAPADEGKGPGALFSILLQNEAERYARTWRDLAFGFMLPGTLETPPYIDRADMSA